MGVDLRQVVAGILTITMFVMLGQMIKRDHFDSVHKLPGEARDDPLENSKVAEQDSLVAIARNSKGPWLEVGNELKPCWTDSTSDDLGVSKGYLTFSLTNGLEYHVSQITDAVVLAKYLGATLVLPDVRGSKPGDERRFEDIYDLDKFIKSLDGVIKVAKDLPDEISIRNLAVVKIPNRVSEDHISENVEPIFKAKGNIRVATYFPSVNMRKSAQKSNSDSVACLAMFGSLELQTEVNDVVNSMVDRLRTLSRKADGRFIAVDLRVDILEKNCQESGTGGTKSCYSAQEIAVFLRKIGFDKDTTIYLTQSRWHGSLDILKDIFPRTYTKESIIPAENKAKYLESENSEFEKVIDFYICSESDVFVPAISGLFYANVVGKRIAIGRPQVLVPAEIPATLAPAASFISPYVAKKNHLAYSCFC